MTGILCLVVEKKWFDKIASGEKTIEYRSYKPYWESRLMRKHNGKPCFKQFAEIHFKNGYKKDAPSIRARHKGTDVLYDQKNDLGLDAVFAIYIGQILKITR